MRPSILSQLLTASGGKSLKIKEDALQNEGPSADYFGDTAADFGNSQYDTQTSTALLTQKNELGYLRGERQSKLDKLGNGLVNMAGKTITTAAEGIINPFYGTIAALTNTKDGKWDPSANAYFNNTFTKGLDNVDKFFEETNPTYENKTEANAKGLAKLWSFNTISRDILGGAGTTIGAIASGAAWSKGLSLLGKAVGAAGSTEEVAAILAEAKQSGIAVSADKLKYVSDLAFKKDIKDASKTAFISLTGASGEAGKEARGAENDVFYKLTHDDFGNEKRMSEGELAYAKMMSQQAGNAAFAMNLPVIAITDGVTFVKALFGNKTNDFAKIAKELTMLDEATGAFKVIEKSKYANLGYRVSKIGGTMVAEGPIQEQLQFGIGKTVENYYTKKYYNPNATDFADSITHGLAEAYGTQEGWHSGIIGALSAGIAGPGMVLATQGGKAFKDEYITNPDDAIAAQAVSSLNQYQAKVMNPKFRDNFVRSANITEDKDEALINNDDFGYHNANDDMIFSYVYNRMQNGKLEDVKQELGNFKDLTVQELKDKYNIEIKTNNESKVNELTSTNAVQKFVNERLDKIAAIEDTYNAVTKLFPNANPEVKELLMYSAQGLKSSKERSKELSESVSNILVGKDNSGMQQLSTVIPGMLITPNTFSKDFVNMSKEQKAKVLDHIENSNTIDPIDKQDISNKLKDLESLKERENDFVAAYNALKNPEMQDAFLKKSETLWAKYTDIAKQKEAQDNEESSKVPTLKHEEWYNKDTTPEDLDSRLKLAEQNKQITPEQAIELSEGYAKLKEGNNNKSYVDNIKDLLAQNNSSKEDLEGLKEILNNIELDENFTPEQQKELLDLVEEKLNNLKNQAIDTSVPNPFEAQNVLITKADEPNEKITSPVDGKTAGEFRAENNLLDFEELYNLLSDIFNNKKPIAYEFITENSFVYLTIDGKKVSAIQKKTPTFKTAEGKPDTESIDRFKAIQALFYAPSGAAKSKAEIEQLNKDLKSGRVKVNVYRNANINHEGNTNRENRKNLEELIYDLEAEGYDYVVYDDVSFKSKSKNVTTEDEKEIEADYKLRAVEEKDNGFTIGGYRLYIIGAKDSTGRIQSYKLNMAQNHNIEQELQDFKTELSEKINEKTPEGKNRWSDKEIVGFVVKFNKKFNLALKPKNDSSGNKKTKVLRFVWTPRTSEHPNGLLSLKYSEANAGQKARFYSFLPTKVDQEEFQKRLDAIFAINKEYKQAKNKTEEEKQEKLKLKAKFDKANQEHKTWLKKNHIGLEDITPNDPILTIDYILKQLNNLSVNGPQGTVMIEDFKVGTVNMDVEKVDTNGDITIEGVFDSSALDTNFKRQEQQNDGSIIPESNAKVFKYSIQVSSTIKTTPITNPILAPKNPAASVTKTKLEQVAEIEAKFNVTIDVNLDGTWERITHLKATGTREDAINYTNVVRQLQTIGYKAKFLKKVDTAPTTTADVKLIITKKDGYSGIIEINDKYAGEYSLIINGNKAFIQDIELYNNSKGKGYGIEVYKQIIDKLNKDGITLVSTSSLTGDASISPQALSVWKKLEKIGLANAADKQIRNFSSGMKQRLKLALAIFDQAPILLLDEPCSNLDQEGILTYHQLMQAYAMHKLIIVASNDPQEYQFCKQQLALANFKV